MNYSKLEYDKDSKIARSFGWKLTRLWYIPVFSIMWFVAPLGILFMLQKHKHPKWRVMFNFSGFIYTVGFFIAFVTNFESNFAWGMLLFMSIAIFIFYLVTAREYLWWCDKLDAKYRVQMASNDKSISKPAPKAEIKEVAPPELGVRFVLSMQRWIREVESESLKDNIEQLIRLAKIVIAKDNVESQKFFMRYTDRLNNLLERYDDIENTRLNTAQMQEAMRLIEDSIAKTVVAFRAEVANMYKSDLLEISAETTIFMQDLKQKGLID